MSFISRRDFLPALVAPMILPRNVAGGSGRTAPSDKLAIAGVGVGGMGGSYLENCESEDIVALCDVDHAVAAKVFERYPAARRYRDFRVMLEKEKGIDAVVIGTPDHTHAAVALAAMALGKHLYCAKPLTRTIAETRKVASAARQMKVATQMSVQSSMSDDACSTAEWIQAGVIGPVREVHVWTDRPVWPQGVARPAEAPPVPATLDWDLWLGPAPVRPFHPIYHPFTWRGWCDFGTGAMGDMACHAFHVVFRALGLVHPTSVHATSSFVMEPDFENGGWMRSHRAQRPESFPVSSIVTWDFPARGSMPPVRMFWYEGGLKPPRPAALERERKLGGSGMLFIGDRGVVLSGFTGGPKLVPESKSFEPPAKTQPRTEGHYKEWIAAAKGGKPASCEFGFASLLAETALLGVVAIRTNRYLEWDAASMRFTNDAAANTLVSEPARAGW